MARSKSIGVVGGVGPYAGLDLVRKVFDNTIAGCDQQHLPLMLFSFPDQIADRPDFLLRNAPINPGEAIGDIMVQLAQAGATVIGMPCNTAHSPRVLGPALEKLRNAAPQVRFVSMIDSVVRTLREQFPFGTPVGLLSTVATFETHLYQDALGQVGLRLVVPDAEGRSRVQEAISSPVFGIKAQSNPVHPEARKRLRQEAERLVLEQGAKAVILGCTEIPLALTEQRLSGVPLVDATDILAKALILAFAPEKLRKEA